MRLKNQLIIIFGSVVIIATLLASFIGFYYIQNQGQSGIKKELQAKADGLNAEIDGWLIGQSKIIETLSVSISDGFNENTFDVDRLSQIMAIPANQNVISDLYLGTPSGKFFDGSGWIPDSDYDPRVRPWYEVAKSTNALAFSDVYLDKVTGKYAISISTPLPAINGEFVGVLSEDILLTTLSDTIASADFGETGNAFLVDDTTLFIAHQDPDLINTKMSENDALADIGNQMVTERAGFTEYQYKGSDKILVYNEIPSTKWLIGVTIDKSEVYKDFNTIVQNYIIFIALISIVAILIAYFVANSIAKPIIVLREHADKLASGDMRSQAQVKGSYEIKELSKAFNTMSENIRVLIGAINNSADQVTTSSTKVKDSAEDNGRISTEISKTINELAQGATDQAESASDGVEAIDTMNDLILNVMETGQTSETLADNIKSVVETGYHSVLDQVALMNENKANTESVNSTISALDEKTEVIGQIVDVISSIASQTNLLALNAAIEAARAGEHGKGFAVVADEVRKLAEQSASSSNEIANLLDEIRTKTKESVSKVMISKEVVSKQEIALEKMKEDFNSIEEAVENMVTQINSMVNVFPQVTKKTEDVSNVIGNIASVTEESAAATEEVAAATQEQNHGVENIVSDASELVKLAEELIKEIQKFQI